MAIFSVSSEAYGHQEAPNRAASAAFILRSLSPSGNRLHDAGINEESFRLKENVSRTFRVSGPRPSVDVQVLDSHTVANGQEVPVGQEYGDCSLGGTSGAAASRTEHLVP